jgi:hypothetical protein
MTRDLTLYPQRGQRVSFVYAELALPWSGVSGEPCQRRRNPLTYTSYSDMRRVCSSGMMFALFFGSDRVPIGSADVPGTPSVVAFVLRGVVC